MKAAASTEIDRFLGSNIESWEQLEVLLLLARGTARPLDVGEVASALRLSSSCAVRALDHLVGRELLTRSVVAGRAVFACPSEVIRSDIIARVRASATDDPVAVARRLNAHALDRARIAAANAFGVIGGDVGPAAALAEGRTEEKSR